MVLPLFAVTTVLVITETITRIRFNGLYFIHSSKKSEKKVY